MKFLISTMITLALLIGYTVTLSAQYSQLNQLFKKSDIRVEQCSCGGSCAVISTTSPPTYSMRSSGNSVWNQPIRVRFTVDDQIQVNDQILRDALAEDSQIAIDEGLYCGEGSAYVYAGQEPLDLTELSDAGIPIRTDAVVAMMTSIDDPTFGTLLDSYILDAKECWGAQKVISLIRDSADGIQEASSVGLTPTDNNHPSEAFKQSAYLLGSLRNHAITHSAGDNDPSHQNGPDITKRPIDTPAGRSYGWGPQGDGGFSGGNALGEGDNGENLASHIIAGHASWLVAIPNLTVSLDLPSSVKVGDMVNMTATSNKDIGVETWEWTFTNGNASFGAADSGNSTMMNSQSQQFSEPGTWTVEVCISNECGGQVDCATATIEVISSNTAPTALCQSTHVVLLDQNGQGTLGVEDLDNRSFDPEDPAHDLSLDNQTQSQFDCEDLGDSFLATLVVTDNEGLSSSCTVDVTVEDNLPPVLSVVDITVEVANGSSTTVSLDDIVIALADNCTVLDNSNVTADRSLEFLDTEKGQTINITLSVEDNEGNTTTITFAVTVTGTTATENLSSIGLRIQNPTTDRIRLFGGESGMFSSMKVIDLTGKPVYQGIYDSNIDISHWSSGRYIVFLQDKDDAYLGKFLKL